MAHSSTPKYQFAVLATDVATFAFREGRLHVLCIQMRKAPFSGMWALPGGLIEPKESLDHSAQRHLVAKTGLHDPFMEQLYTFGRVDRDPFGRVVSVAYLSLLPSATSIQTSKEYAAIAWHPISHLPRFAYDHTEVVAVALERLRAKVTYTNIIAHLLPKEFTLSDLQLAYERILGKHLDKRNFRKKIVALKLLASTGKFLFGQPNRPAALYRFRSQKIVVTEML